MCAITLFEVLRRREESGSQSIKNEAGITRVTGLPKLGETVFNPSGGRELTSKTNGTNKFLNLLKNAALSKSAKPDSVSHI